MNSLPYELLQLIASNLLPRHQCRLGMTSRHCYKYLYNDLLKWHAHKNTLIFPKYYVMNDKVSISECNGRLICNSTSYYAFSSNGVSWFTLAMFNLSKCEYTYTDITGVKYVQPKTLPKYHLGYLHVIHPIGIFDGFYKYIHKDLFASFASIRLSPLLCLPSDILTHIKYRTYDDMRRILGPEIHQYIASI